MTRSRARGDPRIRPGIGEAPRTCRTTLWPGPEERTVSLDSFLSYPERIHDWLAFSRASITWRAKPGMVGLKLWVYE